MTKETFITAEEEIKAITPVVNKLYRELEDFRVDSMTSYVAAGDILKKAKTILKGIEKTKKEKFMDHLNALRNNTIALFAPPIDKLETVIEAFNKKISAWITKQQEIERVAQEKAEAEAREKERIEQERLRKESEARAAEARKAQEEADAQRRKAEELARKDNFARSEKARLEAEESQKRADALKQESKDIKQESKEVEIEVKDVKSRAPKIEGLGFRTYWKFEIIDADKLPREFLKSDEVAIGAYVSQQKELAKIPGVRVYSEKKSVTS